MEPLLSVRNLIKEFPVGTGKAVVHAVNDVTFDIAAGQCVALVGESGSGKTTVGRCMLGLEHVTRGSILFRGQELTSLSTEQFRRQRSRVQMVFQEPTDSLTPRMTVREIIEEPLILERKLNAAERESRIRELMQMVRLEPYHLDRYPHSLSDGQAQRVGIARALATRPDLIVLDEPTSLLDISVRAEIIDLLKDLQQREGVAYLFISHDLLAVRNLADFVAVMYLGKIVEYGPTSEIFARPMHPYSRSLMSSVLYPDPEIQMDRLPLQGEIPSPINLPKGCFLASRCPMAVERCHIDTPPLEAFGEQHLAACSRIREVGQEQWMEQTGGRLAAR